MLAGYPPFQSSTQEEIYKKVKNLTYAWPKERESGNHIPQEAKDVVSLCLSLEEDERPEPDEIVDHPFFNMYSGCIPRQLESDCRYARPEWILRHEPRGDCMSGGTGIDSDPKYAAVAAKYMDWVERYEACKNEFYIECGVGKTPEGVLRKAAGKRCSKTAWAECAAEEALGLQPVMPLPVDRVYSYHVVSNKDWSVQEAEVGNESNSSTGDEEEQDNKVASQIQAARAARSQQALAAQLRRKDLQPKNHAAMLRQPAPATRQASATIRSVPPASQDIGRLPKIDEPVPMPPSQNLLGERPIRTRPTRVISGYQGTLRDRPKPVAPTLPKSQSTPADMTRRTRAQARQQMEAQPAQPQSPVRRRKPEVQVARSFEPDGDRLVAVTRALKTMKVGTQESLPPSFQDDMLKPTVPASIKQQLPERQEPPKPEIKPSRTGSQKRSTLGQGPLIHPEEKVEFMPASNVSEVMADLRTYLSEFRKRQGTTASTQGRTRRRQQQQQPGQLRSPHSYVVKWVDYTNRYGIGYVLDDGSVGCIFKAENGRPASCVVLREGEKHIRRKAHAREHPNGPRMYSECGQLVPRRGRPVEFYENVELDTGLRQGGGVKRVLVSPAMFEMKYITSSDGSRVRAPSGVERPKCEGEKVKRVKLVDQFGKYMIGSLGRGDGDDNLTGADDPDGRYASGPYVKFYQRLGNVGIWGFGDGALQVSYSDYRRSFQFITNWYTVQLPRPHQGRHLPPQLLFVVFTPNRLLPPLPLRSPLPLLPRQNASLRI